MFNRIQDYNQVQFEMDSRRPPYVVSQIELRANKPTQSEHFLGDKICT